MPALLMIVARDRRPLYERLREELHTEDTVDVLLDRRVSERRRDDAPVPVDQRRADRRQAELDAQLKRIGWATIRVR